MKNLKKIKKNIGLYSLYQGSRFGLMVLLVAISLSACKVIENISQYNLPSQNLEESVAEEKKEPVPPSDFQKKEISLIASTFKSLNPYAPQDKSMEIILGQAYQGLMTLSASGDMVGDLADQVILSEDTLSCRVILGQKQFHDGTPVRLGDLTYSLEKARLGKYGDQVGGIKKISQQGENQFQIEFHSPGILNLNRLTFPIVAENSLEKGRPLEINGTGPYRLAAYKPMQSLSLVSNSNQVEISLSRSEQNLAGAFLNGLTDVYFSHDFPWFSFSEEMLHNIWVFPSPSFYYMGFRLNTGLMADQVMRRYLVSKLDMDRLYQKAFLNHIIRQDLPYYKARDWQAELDLGLGGDLKGIDLVDTNPIPAGQKLVLIYQAEDKYMALMAQAIEEDWQAYVGIESMGLAQDQYLEALSLGNFDLYLARFEVDSFPNINDLLSRGGRYNYSGLGILDQKVNSFLAASREEDLKTAYISLANEIRENTWWVPFGFLENAVILSNQVEGRLTPKPYDILSGLNQLKVKASNYP